MTLQKSPRYLNPKLLQLARGMHCAHCGIEDGTTVAAHSPFAIHGHGRGIKSHDCFVAFLDYRCHAWLDQDYGLMDGFSSKREDKLEFFRNAHTNTILHLLKIGKIKLADEVCEGEFFLVGNEREILDYWREGKIHIT